MSTNGQYAKWLTFAKCTKLLHKKTAAWGGCRSCFKPWTTFTGRSPALPVILILFAKIQKITEKPFFDFSVILFCFSVFYVGNLTAPAQPWAV